jgi:hypothetical protein
MANKTLSERAGRFIGRFDAREIGGDCPRIEISKRRLDIGPEVSKTNT